MAVPGIRMKEGGRQPLVPGDRELSSGLWFLVSSLSAPTPQTLKQSSSVWNHLREALLPLSVSLILPDK